MRRGFLRKVTETLFRGGQLSAVVMSEDFATSDNRLPLRRSISSAILPGIAAICEHQSASSHRARPVPARA